MDKVKQVLSVVLIASFIYLSVEVAILVRDARQQLNTIAPKLETTAQNLSNASTCLAKSSAAVEKVSTAEANLLTNEKTAAKIGVLVRKADNIARIVDDVEKIVDQVNQDTVPKANKAIEASTDTLNSATSLLKTTDKSVADIALMMGKDLEELRQLLADEHLKQLLANITATSEEVNKTSQHIDATTEEVQKAIPELIAELKAISHHTDDSTGEIATFLAGLNKPLSKKQKLYRALVQAAAIAAPAVLRR